jgi:signal-transduction protein with cAMP-binding, CBS, and nucleotidyltransferase domain
MYLKYIKKNSLKIFTLLTRILSSGNINYYKEHKLNISKLMTHKVATISTKENIINAAARMRELNVGSLVVVTGEEVEGIITTWDITSKCIAIGSNPANSVVYDYMTSPVHTGNPQMNVVDAARIMADRKITRLPIMEKNILIGIITFADIANALNQFTKDVVGSWKTENL